MDINLTSPVALNVSMIGPSENGFADVVKVAIGPAVAAAAALIGVVLGTFCSRKWNIKNTSKNKRKNGLMMLKNYP